MSGMGYPDFDPEVGVDTGGFVWVYWCYSGGAVGSVGECWVWWECRWGSVRVL